MPAPRTFADLPAEVERRVRGGERVLLVLLDAFGLRFAERHEDHPLLRRLDHVTPLASQFPSTTTAHVTTMHTGLPVGAHGLYEWNVLDPALGRVVTPLRATTGLERLLPDAPRFYERLCAPSWVFQPAWFSPSPFDRVAIRGAALEPYTELADAVRTAAARLAAVPAGEGGAYAYVYFDGIDGTGHGFGPSSAEFDAACRWALGAVEDGLAGVEGVTALLTADHGQVDVDPERTVWLDDLHPPLRDLPLAPAGSARDVFLHVAPGDVDAVVAALSPHVETVRVAALLAEGAFGPGVGPALTDRLATVCVLPPPDRMAWLRSATDLASRFRGHHGGRSEAESRTWLGELRLG